MRRARPAATERAIQAQIKTIMRLAGVWVYSTSQYRPSHVSEGIPDLYLICEHGASWMEVKRPGGKLSAAQETFQARCRAANVGYTVGGIDEAWALLHSWSRARLNLFGQWTLARIGPNGLESVASERPGT